MDRAITKKTWTPGRFVLITAVILIMAFAISLVLKRSGVSRLTVNSERLSISSVSKGEFREYYPFDGTVVPETSVYLDLEEGGQVVALYNDGGQWVEKGTPILKISNSSLQRTSIDSETRLLENLDGIANSQFRRAQDSLMLKDQLLDMEYWILDLQKKFNRFKTLVESDNNLMTIEEYENVRDELAYRERKRDLLEERIRQEDLLSERQLKQAEESVRRLNQALALLSRLVESLEITAPISGHLSSIDAQIGQNLSRGTRIGQIDLLDNFKIKVKVDQYYLSDIVVGTQGKFKLDGLEYPVEVSKIYPEVVEGGIFYVDAGFSGDVPENIRRGQTLTVELVWGTPEEALMVRKGGFYQQTGGRWAYLISEDGETASKAEIRLGRQNPQHVEVLEGLKEGDRIITSGYDIFNEMELLEFTESVN